MQDAEVKKITAYLSVLHNDAPEFWLTINTVLIGLYYSRTLLFRSPKGNGKKFEIAGFRNNRGSVKFVTMNHFLIKYSTV